jgi:hypothetical protein
LQARLQAAIYEVLVPTNTSSLLDATNLTEKLGNEEVLFKALQEAGKTRMLCRVDQPVNIYSDTILLGASEPGLMQPAGQTTATISYMSTGFIIRLSAKASIGGPSNEAPEVTIAAQVAALPGGNEKDTPASNGRGLHSAMLNHTAPLELDRPFLMVAAGTNRPGVEVQPAIYVARFEFSKPDEPAGTSASVPDANETDFQATLYEVELSADRAAALNAKALSRQAESVGSLMQALKSLGKARILYHTDQPANIFSDQFQGSVTVPMTLLAKTAPSGTVIRNVSNNRVGSIVSHAAFPALPEAASKNPEVLLELQFSSPARSDISPESNAQATSMRTFNFRHSELLQLDQPRVFVSVRQGQGTNTNLVASVVRYAYRKPERKTAPTNLTTVADGKLPAQFQATVYEVRAAPGKWEGLDSRELARNTTADALLSRLKELGNAEAIYRIDQPVDAVTKEIHQETSQPVTGTQSTFAGSATTTARMESATLDVSLSTKTSATAGSSATNSPATRVVLQLSLPIFDNPQPTPGTMAPLPRRTMLFEHTEPIRVGEPVVMLYASTDGLWEDLPPVLYIVRYQFNSPMKK